MKKENPNRDGVAEGAEAVHDSQQNTDTVEPALLQADAFDHKPRLLIDSTNPNLTVAALRNILAEAGRLFDRGGPVRLAYDQVKQGNVAQRMTPDAIVLHAHGVCRPYIVKRRDGAPYDADALLPRSTAAMYCDWRGEWRLPPLNGFATAPLLQDDGGIKFTDGYDEATGMWCENVPDLAGLVTDKPTMDDAASALRLIRKAFRTFCFADAEMIDDEAVGVPVVDLDNPPGRDESSFLVALLTAVCRPSLHLAPGILLRAAQMSGAGAGKGLLARCMCIIAFGREPHAVTAGATLEEQDKRISAELIEGSPTLFLDNLNNCVFKSDLLASAITERPASVRILGKSVMMPLNALALVILTGNGLALSEDLVRRFISIDLDPRTEDPEARPFKNDILSEMKARRKELLAALLTIWRWGRIKADLSTGLPLGSFTQWGRWVRDPLCALGCHDPVDRVKEAKRLDGRRQQIAEFFLVWFERHGDRPITAHQLHDDAKRIIDPQGHSRQHFAKQLASLAGTRTAGFLLTAQPSLGKHGATTYALVRTGIDENNRGHRDHRTIGGAHDPYGIAEQVTEKHLSKVAKPIASKAPEQGNGRWKGEIE